MKTLAIGLIALGLLLGAAGAASAGDRDDDHGSRHHAHHERFLYVATIAQSNQDPDFVTAIGADPRHHDFGRIVNRIDMPDVGDELHHFGYSYDQKRLIVPGLFSNRMHIFSIQGNGSTQAFACSRRALTGRIGEGGPAGRCWPRAAARSSTRRRARESRAPRRPSLERGRCRWPRVAHPGAPFDCIGIVRHAAPDLRAAFVEVGAEVGGEPPEVFAAFVRAEHARWGGVIAESKIRLE